MSAGFWATSACSRPSLRSLTCFGPGVERDDLHGVLLAGLAQAAGGALGREQVRREDALEVGVLGQLRLDDRRGLVGLVLAVVDADVVEPELLGLFLEALGAQVGGRDARLDVDRRTPCPCRRSASASALAAARPPPSLSEAICETAKSAWSSVVSTSTTLMPASADLLDRRRTSPSSPSARSASRPASWPRRALTIGVCSVGSNWSGPWKSSVDAQLLGLGLGPAVHRDVELVALDAGDQRHLVASCRRRCCPSRRCRRRRRRRRRRRVPSDGARAAPTARRGR